MKNDVVRPIRRRRLKKIVGSKRGDIADFADKYELDPSVISNLMNGKRGFTEGYARDIELKAGLPTGYLDSEDAAESQPGTLEHIEHSIKCANWMDDKTKAHFIGLIKLIGPPKP